MTVKVGGQKILKSVKSFSLVVDFRSFLILIRKKNLLHVLGLQ